MKTKFNIGDEVFIKGKVCGIEVSENGFVYYTVVYLNQAGFNSPIGCYLEDYIYDNRSDESSNS